MDVLNVTEAELYVLIILAQLEPFSFRLGQKIGSSMELCVTLNAGCHSVISKRANTALPFYNHVSKVAV